MIYDKWRYRGLTYFLEINNRRGTARCTAFSYSRHVAHRCWKLRTVCIRAKSNYHPICADCDFVRGIELAFEKILSDMRYRDYLLESTA